MFLIFRYIAEMMRTKKPKEFWEHWEPLREKNAPVGQKQPKKQAEKAEKKTEKAEAVGKPATRRSKRMAVERKENQA